jgi:hypothetical protein
MKGGGGGESARLRWVRRKRRGSVSPSTAMFTWIIVVSSIPLCYVRNRSFAPILRQSQCLLLFDVY